VKGGPGDKGQKTPPGEARKNRRPEWTRRGGEQPSIGSDRGELPRAPNPAQDKTRRFPEPGEKKNTPPKRKFGRDDYIVSKPSRI